MLIAFFTINSVTTYLILANIINDQITEVELNSYRFSAN